MMLRLFVIAAAAFAALAAERIPLEGSRNFRDIGGYETIDGRRIKMGRVFRSDALAKLTAKDYETLAALKIRTVCDFRSKAERDREPTQWQGVAPEFLLLEIGGGQHGNRDPAVTFMRPILEGKATPAQVENMMRDTTAQMPLVDGKQYAPMLRRLTASSEPLLYHCTAGKDRTGLATAFLMKILGVKPDQIEADYLLVNKLMPAEAMAPAMAKRMEAMAGGPVDPVLIQPLMGTKAEWLRAAFAAIDEKYGSFDAFRRDVLQITSEDAAVLRLRLLE